MKVSLSSGHEAGRLRIESWSLQAFSLAPFFSLLRSVLVNAVRVNVKYYFTSPSMRLTRFSPPLRGPLVGDKWISRQLSTLLPVKIGSQDYFRVGDIHVSNCEGGLMHPYLPSADVTRELPLFQKRRQMRSGI
jgi:hypothetical protein